MLKQSAPDGALPDLESETINGIISTMKIYPVRPSSPVGKNPNRVSNTAISGAVVGACVSKNPVVGAVIGGGIGALAGKHEPEIAAIINIAALFISKR